MSLRHAVLAALPGCFTGPVPQAPRPVVAWPDHPHATPLAVGQWALYRERDGDDVSYARFEAVSTGACGTWVRVVLYGHGPGRLWMLCVRPSGAIETAILDGSIAVDPAQPGEHAGDLAGLASRLAPPALDGPGEDVQTDAGTFAKAVHRGTTWIHPAVPFGGVVRIAAGPAREDVLVAYGDHPPPPAPQRHRPRLFLEGGGGIGWLSGTKDREPSRTDVLAYDAGMQMAPTWDFVFGLSGGSTATDSYQIRNTHLVLGGGVRIRPLAGDLYVRFIGGFARLWNEEFGNANSFGIAAAVGYPILRARDWRISAELGDEASFFGGDVGMRDAVHATAVLELRLP
jgi:hypothetical protein